MSGRWFAQINCSLLQSKKFLSLKDHTTMHAYFCTHLSVHCNYLGIFEYPKVTFANDARIEKADLNPIIDELERSKLIEFDHNEEVIRIVGWHHQITGAVNSSCARSRISDYRRGKIANGPLLIHSVAEFSAAIVKRSLDWNPEKGERAKLHEKLRPFLQEFYQDSGPEFLTAICAEIGSHNNAIEKELRLLLPPLAEHRACTVPPPWRHSIKDDTKKEKKRKKENHSMLQKIDSVEEVGDDSKSNETNPAKKARTEKRYQPSDAMPREETKRSELVTGKKMLP